MIKLTMLAKHKAHLSYEEFDHYWHENHAVLVNSVKDILGIVRYVHTVPMIDKSADEAMRTSRNSLLFDFDGMGEIW